jgi:hypothetical protein
MQLYVKQYSFSNKLIIKRKNLSKLFILKQLPKEIYTFYFFIFNKVSVANIVFNIAF